MKISDLPLSQARRHRIKPRANPQQLVQLVYRMPWGLIERLDALADRFDVRRAVMVRLVLEAGVKDLEADQAQRDRQAAEVLKGLEPRIRRRKLGEGRMK